MKDPFWRSVLSDESAALSSVRVMALILVCAGIALLITGVFYAGFSNKTGAEFCNNSAKWSFALAAGKLGFGQAKSAYIGAKQAKHKEVLP